jgi:hypothetical protein
MAHFAKVNTAGVVEEVIVAEQDFIDSGAVGDPSAWVKTSYNMRAGTYIDPETNKPAPDQAAVIGDDPARNRKNYASVGCTYDADLDAFIPPQIYDSWTLNLETCVWVPPQEEPTAPKDSEGNYLGYYQWSDDEYHAGRDGWVYTEYTD